LPAAIRTTPPHIFRSDHRGSHLRVAEVFRNSGKTKIFLDSVIAALCVILTLSAAKGKDFKRNDDRIWRSFVVCAAQDATVAAMSPLYEE